MGVADRAAPKRRGKNKAPRWRRDPNGPVSVLPIALDVSDPHDRRRVEKLFSASYRLRRALQAQASSRCRAYWAARHERKRSGPDVVLERLGLGLGGMEEAAREHLDGSGHLRHHLTKALAAHMADAVWADTSRHLFVDSSGRRSGMPGPGRWFDFSHYQGARARIPWSTSGRPSAWWGPYRATSMPTPTPRSARPAPCAPEASGRGPRCSPSPVG